MIAVEQIRAYGRAGSAPPGVVLARIASRQHGVVTRPQVLALGVSANWVKRAWDRGLLHQVHLGVYAVGHAYLTQRGTWMAAVLAGGERAALAYWDAAVLLEIAEPRRGKTHVVVPGPSSHRRPGLALHRTRHLPAEHVTSVDGIPVTTPRRTLLDLAAVTPAERLRFVVEAADRRGLLDVLELVRLCDGSPGRRGTGRLRRIALEQRGPIRRTKSPPERAFLRRCIRRGLPEPRVNTRLHGYEVDFHWPQANLVVEIDSYAFHRSWAQRRRDIARDADLKARGIEVLRFLEEQMLEDEERVFAQIGALLARVRSAAA